MPVDVIILPRGSTFPLDWWSEGEVPDESGGYKFDMDKWRGLPLLLAHRALNDDWSQPEVFLCLRGDHLRGRYEAHYFKALVETAKEHCWGRRSSSPSTARSAARTCKPNSGSRWLNGLTPCVKVAWPI